MIFLESKPASEGYVEYRRRRGRANQPAMPMGDFLHENQL
jgi:hypothetical protein